MEEKTQTIRKMNDELLKKDAPPDEKPKRNSKEFLIGRIVQLADENDLELTMSTTKLKRMTKDKLQALLGEMCEEAVKTQMAEAVGAPSGGSESVIALATLRMIHDLVANSVEKGANSILPRYGYRIEGFAEALKEPTTRECVDDCLKEIAAESDVLQYVQSPYARLAICWSGGLMRAVRRAPQRKYRGYGQKRNTAPNANFTFVGPLASVPEDPVRARPSGRATPGQEHRGGGPAEPNVQQV